MLIGKKWLFVSVAALSIGLVGFNRLSMQSKNINDPKAEALLNRTFGQTEFANPISGGYTLESSRGFGAPPPMAASAPSQKRAVQEADVFKIGKKGSKLLYLLNSMRGLQVVSYADGVEKPKLIGRVEGTGNMPRDMYYIEKLNRLVVLENVYFDRSGKSQYSDNQARLVVYDVGNDKAPKIEQIVEFKGAVRDSRLVGDILYVGSSIEPSWMEDRSNTKRMGMVQSFHVGSGQVAKVSEYQLSLPMSYNENMNIIEVKKGDGYLYYVVAVLENSSWGFWARNTASVIEVVDISDAYGEVKPVMKVVAKGNVRERSQTVIKDGTLVVVSNYSSETLKNAQGRPIARVAVETFKLPSSTAEVISESEAQFRQLWVDRELLKANLSGEEAIETKRKELLADKDYGLAGRFVQLKTSLNKIYADSTVTVGDTTGMSSDLRDVRVDGNNLYVFWVPANNIDPLDLFDLSNLDQGMKYVSRLQFEGWIERAVPFTVQGRQFVLGLGWIIPAQDNEHGNRKAQASLFEIFERSGKKTSLQLAQIELSEQGAWSAGFQQQDKYLDVRDNGDGTGSLLFSQYAKVGQTWKEGGKLVSYDFNKVLADKADQFFTEGGFLVGGSNWIKRIFTNTEINRINAFSDMSLATYQDSSKLATGGLVQAADILELARQIKSYELMGEGQNTVGVQVVAKGDSWGQEDATTEVRITSTKTPDAELQDGMSVTSLPGAYSTHVKLNATSMLVYTSKTEYLVWDGSNKQREPKTEHNVYLLKFNGQKSVVADTQKWTTEGRGRSGISFRTGFYSWYHPSTFIKLSDGSYLLSGVPTLKIFKAAQGLSSSEYQYKDCPVEAVNQQDQTKPMITAVNVRALGGKLFVFHTLQQKLGQSDLLYGRNYLSSLTFDKSTATCGKAVNIPGDPLSLEGDNLVTTDMQALDVVTYMRPDWQDEKKKTQVWEYITSEGLSSTKFSQASASLEDMQWAEDSTLSNMKKIGKNEFLFIKSPGLEWRLQYYPGVHKLVFVTLDGYKFKTQVKGIYLETSMPQDIASVVSQGENRLAVLTSNNGIRVLKWNAKNREPAIVPVKTSSAFGAGEFGEAAYVASYFYGLEGRNVTFDPSTNTMLLSLSTSGIKAVEMQK